MLDLARFKYRDVLLNFHYRSKSARERDYHRQKYLESRGWKIHRIWSTNWWKNPKLEIEKIKNIVESL